MEFFATLHENGGIGGTAKRAVWRDIPSVKNPNTTAQEYAVLAKQLFPKYLIFMLLKVTYVHVDQQRDLFKCSKAV